MCDSGGIGLVSRRKYLQPVIVPPFLCREGEAASANGLSAAQKKLADSAKEKFEFQAEVRRVLKYHN